MASLAASEGDTTRCHRDYLINTNFKRIGAPIGTYPVYRYCTIIFFCTKFTSKDGSNDVGFFNGPNSAPSNIKKEEGRTLKPKKNCVESRTGEVKKEEAEEKRDDVVSKKRTEKFRGRKWS